MKTKKIVYTLVDKRPPKKGEWFRDGELILCARVDFCKNNIREIYTREEIIEEWKPKKGEEYYYSSIEHPGLYRKTTYVAGYTNDKHRISLGLAFPTKELAIAKAKEILSLIKKNDNEKV